MRWGNRVDGLVTNGSFAMTSSTTRAAIDGCTTVIIAHERGYDKPPTRFTHFECQSLKR